MDRLEQQKRQMRALICVFVVVAQMLLPAVALRAEALASAVCVADNSSQGPSESHAHDGRCCLCAVHVSSPPIPALIAGSCEQLVNQQPAAAAKDRRGGSLYYGSPPPTGPPQFALSSGVH